MSFCEEQKKEITEANYKSLCCRKALLSGVLAAKGTVTSDGCVTLRVSGEGTRAFISALVEEAYSKTPDISSPIGGGRAKLMSFKSSSAAKFVAEIQNTDKLMYTPRCGACRSAFLRGAFLAAGSVSEPQKQYSLELSVGERMERFFDFFQDLGIDLKPLERKGVKTLYTKNSTAIEDFFGLAAMNGTAFALMNSKIKSELRNDANRVANCEMNNIDKAVNTAMRQVAIISALEEAGLLGALPDELALTARLRLEYNSLSLSQLAGKFTPSISKPGLSHRLNKIEAIGKKLLENVK